MSATMGSPHRLGPGCSRWPGFLRKQVTVSKRGAAPTLARVLQVSMVFDRPAPQPGVMGRIAAQTLTWHQQGHPHRPVGFGQAPRGDEAIAAVAAGPHSTSTGHGIDARSRAS